MLRLLFSCAGVPEQTDNGIQFTSKEFQLFAKRNGIKCVASAPCYAVKNGLLEKFIQIFKRVICAMVWIKVAYNMTVNFLVV